MSWAIMKKTGQNAQALYVCAAAFCTILSLIYFGVISPNFTPIKSIVLVIAVLVLSIVYSFMIKEIEKRTLFYSTVLGSVYSVLFVFGRNVSVYSSVLLLEPYTWVGIIIVLVPISFILTCLFPLFKNGLSTITLDKVKVPSFISQHKFLSCFLFIFLIWSICFLAAFPGLYTYDALYQTYDALVLNIVSSFHPLIHTYWLSGCLFLGKLLFSSYEIGMALYSLSQMAIMALIFAYITTTLHSLHHSFLFSILTLIFFGFFPVHIILSFSSTKDVVFSGLIALMSVQAVYAIHSPKDFFGSRKKVAGFIVAGFLLAAFRNNGIYALVAFSPFFIYSLTGFRKKAVALCAGTIVLAAIYCWPFTTLVSTETSNAGEVLGVSMQQLARVINLDPPDLSDAEKEEIKAYLPSWRNYTPGTVDSIKFNDDTSAIVGSDVKGFLSLWIHEGLKYPTVYLDASALMTYGYWYPWANYEKMGSFKPYLEYCMWERDADGHASRWMGTYSETMNQSMVSDAIIVNRQSFIPALSSVLESLSMDMPWQNIPIIRMLFSPGALWILIFSFAVSIYRKQWKSSVPLLLLVFYLGTCLLGPVFLIRYAYPLFTCLPIIIFVLLGLDNSRVKKDLQQQ